MENPGTVPFKAPGKMLIKVPGILMIIYGGILAIISILGIIGGGMVASMGGDVGSIGGGAIILAAIIILIGGAFELVVGIIGVKFCNKPEKAQLCMILAIIAIALQVVGLITGGEIWSVLVGCVLPVLYLIGALQNKKVA